MLLFGDVLAENEANLDINFIKKVINRPIVKPRFKITILFPDESDKYEIPTMDMPQDAISYDESYQNGQRRNLTLKLINKSGKYTPSINGIWLDTRFRLEVGLEINSNSVIWFPRGIYVMGDISQVNEDSNKNISIQLKDKFAVFEGKTGTLEEAYEIEIGSPIQDVLTGILNFSMGNGYILDYKAPILDPSFIGFKTQNTIRVEEGGNWGQVIDELATQLSAEYYYNNVGNLCFYPINETINDANKPIIWSFTKLNRGIQNLNLKYSNEDVVNVVKVVGDNVDGKICSAIVANENPASPICIQQIGRRSAPKYSEANVWSNDTAYDLASYYLRQASLISIKFSTQVSFNPILTINNLVTVENDDLRLKREKLLLTSISFSSSDGQMSLSLCNTSDLPFVK